MLRMILILCAVAGFGGAGAALAVRAHRLAEHLQDDDGFVAVASMLAAAAAASAFIVGGLPAVFAIAIPIGLAGYAMTAQRIGLFRIVTGVGIEPMAREHEHHT